MTAPLAPTEVLEPSTSTVLLGSITEAVRRIARTPAVVATLAALAVGCAGADGQGTDQPVEAKIANEGSDPTIFGGAQDDDGQAVGGVVALRVGAAGSFELCSGALLAPNLVLTARHCVTKNYTTSVSCDQEGHSANGPHVIGDQDPVNIGVYVGASPNFSEHPVAVATAIVAPTGQYLCDSDIALVVLATPLKGIAPLAVRLATPALAGEVIRSVGYGQNDDKLPIGNRFRKTGVEVLAQGMAVSASKTPLGQHEFEVGKSICQGDSGGPAISEDTGAVIGVVSRGGGCDDNFGHIYTTTAGFDELFDQAFTLAGASPKLEVGAPTHLASVAPNAPVETQGTSGNGCSAGASRTHGAAGGVGLLLGLVALLRRRR